MKIKLLFPVLFFVFISSKKEKVQEDQIVFSGKILNAIGKELTLTNTQTEDERIISLDAKGSFITTLKNESASYYVFQVDDVSRGIYLTQGDNLIVEMDMSNPQTSLKFSGTGSKANNYLAKKTLLVYNFWGKEQVNEEDIYEKEPVDFKKVIQNLKLQKNDLLKSSINADTPFFEAQKKYNHYDYLFRFISYGRMHLMITGKEKVNYPDGFMDDILAIEMDNVVDFKASSSYEEVVQFNLQNLANKKVKVNDISYHQAVIEVTGKIKQKTIRLHFLELSKRFIMTPKHPEVEKVYEWMMAASIKDKDFQEGVTQKIEMIRNSKDDKIKKAENLKGIESPSFDYVSHKGGQVTLSQFKGKYVYIDIWATWCIPCIKQLPYLDKINKKYENKNIEFVSISVDHKKKFNKWRAIVEKKELAGIQLFADKGFESDFMKFYQITSIPSFILIDPDGKILDTDAPKPSDPYLTVLLDKLKI